MADTTREVFAISTTDVAQSNLRLYSQLGEAGWSSEEIASLRAVYDFACILFSGSHRGAGKPFITHLVGSASAAAFETTDWDSIAVSLVHASYGSGRFPGIRKDDLDAKRAAMRKVLGDAGENLLHRYRRHPWSTDAVKAYGVSELNPADRDIFLLRIANEIDDRLDGSYYAGPKKKWREPDVERALVAICDRLQFTRLKPLLIQTLEPPKGVWIKGANTNRAAAYWLDENLFDRLRRRILRK